MGKSVRQTPSPFAYKPEYNDQVASTPPPAVENNSPFAFKPEYNEGIKKKDGGSESLVSSPTQSPSGSESQETATDFISKDIDANDFFGQLASQTDKFFPQTTVDRKNTEAAKQTKIDVFSNPKALSDYSAQRITKINEDIKSLKNLQSYATQSQNIKEYADLEGQIRERRQYIQKLKDNVADIATDMVVGNEDPKQFDPKTIGRKIVGIADPELNEQIKTIEKSGGVLPGIKGEELERVGINATKNYISKQPDSPQKTDWLNNVNNFEKDFDERNFQTTWQRAKEKIGSQIYKQGESGWLGFGYSAKKLREVVNDPATGLSDSEKKVALNYGIPLEEKIIGTDIPTSGFTRSFYNAIEKSAINTGKSLGNITGIRTDADVAADVVSQESDQARYRSAGNSPTGIAQLAYLNEKEKAGTITGKEKEQQKELRNYVNVRNNWSKFKDGVGDLTGQVVEMALLSKGLGAAGQLLSEFGEAGGLMGGLTSSTLGSALSNQKVGLIIGGYLNSYDNYKQQAVQIMPGENKAGARDAYAKTMATVEGLSEMIFPDAKILNAFTKGISPAIKDITTRFINKELTSEVARQELKSAVSQYLKPFAKEFAKSELEESTEEAVVDLADGISQSVFGGQSFDIANTGQQAINTFLTTMLYSPLVSGMAGHGAYRQNQTQNAFLKSALVNIAANPTAYLKSVEDLQMSGEITQHEANEKIKLIKSANGFLQELPASRIVETTGVNGETIQENKQLDYPEMSSYMLHRMNEGLLTEKIDNTTDDILKSQLNKELKRSQEIRKGIFNGSIGVTPDLQEVINNPEKAAELGIEDSNEVLPSQLIGTPFQKSENETLQPETAEGEGKSAENKTAVQTKNAATQTTEDQKKALTEQTVPAIKKAIDNKEIKGQQLVIAQMVVNKNDPAEIEQYLKDISDQALNKKAANAVKEKTDTYKAAVNNYGESLVKMATELFPAQGKVSQFKGYLDEDENGGTDQTGMVQDKKMREISTGFVGEIKRDNSSSYKSAEKIANKSGAKIEWDKGSGTLSANSDDSNVILLARNSEYKGKPINESTKLKIKQLSTKGAEFIVGDMEDVDTQFIEYLQEIGAPFTIYRTKGNKEIVGLTDNVANKILPEEKKFPVSKDKKNENKTSKETGSEETGKKGDQAENAKAGNEVLSEQGAEPVAEAPLTEDKTIAQKGKIIADKIRSLKTKRDIAQANIFGIAIGIYDGALEVIATAVEQGARLADAINDGIKYIRENGGEKLDEEGFRQHLEDQAAGKKPKIKVQVGEEEPESQEKEAPKTPDDTENKNEGSEATIEDYSLTTGEEVNSFLSGKTIEDVFGDAPEGDQSYQVQKLSDMLQDGKNMIAIAQNKWGSDVMQYGKPLFEFIQQMGNDAILTNKKAVLLATFLGELKEAIIREPNRRAEISQLASAVESYYQQYMNVRGKEVVAGRLLRFYRDKYIGDVFAERILEENQARELRSIREAEQKRKVDDEVAAVENKPVTKEEKDKQDKAAKERSSRSKSDQAKKKKMSSDEAKDKADQKLKDIEQRMGANAKKGLIERIKDAIKKINCK